MPLLLCSLCAATVNNVTCRDPPTAKVDNSNWPVACQDIAVNGVCTAMCSPGYAPNPAPVTVCGASGSWGPVTTGACTKGESGLCNHQGLCHQPPWWRHDNRGLCQGWVTSCNISSITAACSCCCCMCINSSCDISNTDTYCFCVAVCEWHTVVDVLAWGGCAACLGKGAFSLFPFTCAGHLCSVRYRMDPAAAGGCRRAVADFDAADVQAPSFFHPITPHSKSLHHASLIFSPPCMPQYAGASPTPTSSPTERGTLSAWTAPLKAAAARASAIATIMAAPQSGV